MLAHRHVGPELPTLHLTNGDATVPQLLATGLVERVLPWRDVLHEGPVPNVPDAELRRVRAAFLPGEAAADIGTAAEFAERDRMLEAHRNGEYVLWFEADLYDQLQIVQILARLRALAVAPEAITLICIGEHAGIAHFGGLGELDAAQLARLPEVAGTPLSAAALAHAALAWDALRAPDPAGLAEIAATPSSKLRFLAEAFDRLGREYPSTRDGLSLTERRILAAIAEGALTCGETFLRAARRKTRSFLGDTWCFDRMDRMADARSPLLEVAPAASAARHAGVRITDTGRRVLDGTADHVTLNGIDRWIGGVHLRGHTVSWRWDEGREAVVAPAG